MRPRPNPSLIRFPNNRRAALAALVWFAAAAFSGRAVAAAENRIVLNIEPGEGNPRNSEGAFLELRDGRILFAYTRFYGGSGDEAGADIAAVHSSDQGLTWSRPPVILFKNDADENIMSVSLLRLQDGRIAIFYLKKNHLNDCRLYMRISGDEGKSWGLPVLTIPAPGYFVVNNDRVIQLGSRRLVVPAAFHRFRGGDSKDYKNFDGRGIAIFFLSDDGGATWRESDSWRALGVDSQSGLREPGVVELRDGRLFSWSRTDRGCQYGMTSGDGGITWDAPRPTGFKSPNSPLSMKRMPDGGDLLAVWNDHSGRFPVPRDFKWTAGRSPLVSAISRDDGKTWESFRQIESSLEGGYCYTAMAFVGRWVLLGYCAGDADTRGSLNRLRIRRVDRDWFYEGADR
ncbi:MAG TPA: sialidase family protein [Candidatus Aminicenantes bacterium]|nr:sialidase family protein [Candidatus Aminicenantes bacterium]